MLLGVGKDALRNRFYGLFELEFLWVSFRIEKMFKTLRKAPKTLLENKKKTQKKKLRSKR